MTLARLMGERPDELRADFQQYYGLNLDGLGSDFGISHAAVLASQLPPNARSYSVDEMQGLTIGEMLLSAIEYNTRLNWWKHSKAAQDGDDPPRPILDFSSHEGEFEVEELKELLARERTEVTEDGR